MHIYASEQVDQAHERDGDCASWRMCGSQRASIQRIIAFSELGRGA